MRLSTSWTAAAIVALLATPGGAQQPPGTDEATRLREVVAAQQRQLDEQRRQLDELRDVVQEQGRAIAELRARDANVAVASAAPPPGPTATPHAETQAAAATRAPAGAVAQEVNPTQEIANEAPAGPALDIGPAEVRLGGYLALTGTYRSTNSGGNVGTSFGSTPYADTVQGNVSETRFSAQSTRLSLRVDAPLPPGSVRFSKLAGYVEMDFAGSTPGTVAVTSSSVGFRLRQAFGEVVYGDAFFLGLGQAFSLMTPAKDQLSVWPSAYELTRAVDTNYVAGLVWNRLPQVRLAWRPSRAFNWAFSVENPEQQVGRGLVTFPACCAGDLEAQYNTGGDELRVPNLMPDLATRVAFNAGEAFHADLGGVFRAFRHTLAPYDEDFRQAGGGVSANLAVRPASSMTILVQGSWGDGMGRYVGGLVPDVVVRADGTISPVRSRSWLAGFEHQATHRTALAAYYSGVYASSNVGVDDDGTFIGYGYPGASNASNRTIREATGVVAWQIVKTPDRGSLQWNAQTSWLTRTPWSRGTGPASADAFLFLTQIRYNLP